MPARVAFLSLFLTLSGGISAPSLYAQSVRGRVVDEPSRSAIEAADVLLRDTVGALLAVASSDTAGFFTFHAPSFGTFEVVVRRVGYSEVTRSVTVDSAMVTVPAFVLVPLPVPLDELSVRASARRDEAVVGFRRPSLTIAGARLEGMERAGLDPLAVARELPGLRMRRVKLPSGEYIQCIESTRRIMTLREPRPPCEPVVLVIDDIPVGDPYRGLRELRTLELESVEFMTPVEAGYRYGMGASAVGAIVVWTRGRGPHASAQRNGGGA